MNRSESTAHPVQAVCVFCGSSPGADPTFLTEARALGRLIAETGRSLVYGGAKLGLMGAVADGALAAGGKVIGVLPRTLVGKEIAHEGLTDLRIVETMHERKATMADLAGAFVAMPGGLGTLEELFEMWTWGQLGLHRKPLALFGTRDFFAPLLDFLDRLVEQRFLWPAHRQMLIVEDDPARLLARLDAYQPVFLPKWIDRTET
jgi:uncharacterized protein (TIGR00730 family)